MCGICGKFSPSGMPDPELMRSMARRMAHRGPDAMGIWNEGALCLGHRRLSIIDTSSAADQPMLDARERAVISYNGEIYNFRELRRELTDAGCRFRTKSDTEVVLNAYLEWGPDCLSRFVGMFALAIYDRGERTLFLARDRFGKKPLFYHDLPDGGIVFASEASALLEDPDIPRTPSARGLSQFLSLGYTLTSASLFAAVRKLPPAHWLRVSADGGRRLVRWWDYAAAFRRESGCADMREAAAELSHILDDAVKKRLVSDVPIGCYLSGGIDSSAIVQSMCTLRPAGLNKTFSIGFSERGYSELEQARAVACVLGVNHTEEQVTADNLERLSYLIGVVGEPFADSSLVPTALLAEFAGRAVTVCLTGDGGDELFAGYETYVADRLAQLIRHVPAGISLALHRGLERWWPADHGKVSLNYKLKQFLSGADFPPARAHYHWRTLFGEAEKRELLVPELAGMVAEHDPFDDFAAFHAEVEDLNFLDQALYVDAKTWLAEDILVKADRAAMAYSIECRSPFLDHRLAEFAASLPAKWKLSGLKKKAVLKQAMHNRLPGFVLNARKRGFNAPVSRWFSSLVDAGEMQPEFLAGEWFRPESIGTLIEEHRTRRRDNGLKLLALVTCQIWRDQMSPASLFA